MSLLIVRKNVIQGHNKPITALTVTTDRKDIYTACSDGNVCIRFCHYR